MKHLIFCFLVLFILGNISCKTQPPAAGTYVTNSHVDKFEGTWKWTSGNNEVIFKLKKFKHRVIDYDEDIILGSHSYKQNGSVVETNIADFANIVNNHKLRSIYVSNDPAVSTNKVSGDIKDVTKGKYVAIAMEYVQGSNPAQIVVTLTPKHQNLTKSDQQPGITLPVTFTLTKQ